MTVVWFGPPSRSMLIPSIYGMCIASSDTMSFAYWGYCFFSAAVDRWVMYRARKISSPSYSGKKLSGAQFFRRTIFWSGSHQMYIKPRRSTKESQAVIWRMVAISFFSHVA